MFRKPTVHEQRLAEILVELNLYSGVYEWNQLDTNQKDLWADVMDEFYASENKKYEYTLGDSMYLLPFERWWRD